MRKIYKKIFSLFITVIALFALQGIVKGATLPYFPEAYQISPDLFCMNSAKALLFYANGKAETDMHFTETYLGNPEPSVAYAVWMGGGDLVAIQNAVWASEQWGNSSNVVEQGCPTHDTSNSSNTVEARSYQYGTVYYKIFSQLGNNPLFTINHTDLKMMVDQNNKTYTVGPYTLTVNAGDNEAKQILYNELIGSGNQGYSDASRFAKFNAISGLNGTNPIFLNSSRNQIPFPDFVNGEEFYIQFQPNNDGEIDYTGDFTIDVDYIASMSGRATEYTPQSLDFYNVSVQVVSYSRHKETHEEPIWDRDEDGNAIITGYRTVFDYWEFSNIRAKVDVRATKGGGYWTINYNPGTMRFYSQSHSTLTSADVTEEVLGSNGHLNTSDSNTPGITNYIQPIIEIIDCSPNWSTLQSPGQGFDVDMYIGGYVWQELSDLTKESDMDGRFNNGAESKFAGIQVELYDANTDTFVSSTTTDQYGAYGFKNINPMHKYYVRFIYNGMVYQDTYYKNDLSGGYSTARERDSDREDLNLKFETIDSSPDNYQDGGWKKVYSFYEKIKNSRGDYISYSGSSGTNADINEGAFRFCDAWDIFKELATYGNDYDMTNKDSMENTYIDKNTQEMEYKDIEGDFKSELGRIGVSSQEQDNIWEYIQDCLISSYTINYPEENVFLLEDIDNPQDGSLLGYDNLYTKDRDQSRNVDFGLYLRDTADLGLQKDVYKAIVRVNGKTHEYEYNKKDADIDDDGAWNISVRAADYLYNGDYRYTREIRKSEYLYDGSIYGANGGTDAKDLQVYVTYRIAVRNQSASYDTIVNEIVDYYDANEYEYDENNPIISENTYVGDRSGDRIGDLDVNTSTTLGNGRGDTTLTSYYEPLYLSGITDENGNEALPTNGGMAFVYLTLKVKTHTDENGMDGRVQMDVNVSSGSEKGVGKRNIAEINGYSTYYKDGATIPDELDSGDSTIDEDVGGDVAGVIDLDSSVGNLSDDDIDNDGDLIIDDDPVSNRTEDDTDKAPNIKLVFPQSDADERTFTGYVFEDNRTEASGKAAVGNGRYDSGEAKINGVTVQLVELVQEVDASDAGSPTGNYLGEYVWYAKRYENGNWVDVDSSSTSGSRRYYSGQIGTVAPIITGPGATAVGGYDITEEGQYAFKAIPAGDFFIRFIYGDTTQTTLTTSAGEGSEVVGLLTSNGITTDVNGEQGFISTEGLNAKSYNGQDYKSTTYQAGVSQTGSYNGVDAYTRYDEQNYNITINENQSPVNGSSSKYQISKYIDREATNVDGTKKNVMYYYNIGESATQSGVSDAKDVGNIRDSSNNYSSGKTDIDGETHQTLVNSRAEVLAAGLKVNSNNNVNDQVSMIKELMDNTAMTSQTGVINTEIEYNRTETGDQGDNNGMSYVIDDIDLGLAERPVAQLNMDKEVTNMRITLADGTILFDTGHSVTNVSYAEHTGHIADYLGVPDENNGPAYRLLGVTMGANSESTPELITTYMDEELMYGARIELIYTFTVTNIGEVDYMDNQFYYTGVSNAPNDLNNVSTSRADTVVDYVSNNLQFLPTNSNNSTWSIRTVDDLVRNTNAGTNIGDNTNLINTKFTDTLRTYNALTTTKALGDTNLYPETFGSGTANVSTQMMLSSTLTPDSGDDSMVYNNLAEMVQVSNDQGRRMKFSIVGNQAMADQSLGVGDPANPDEGIYTKSDLVTPEEPDADSSQQVLILPPTGANRNYVMWIVIGLVIAVLIGGSIFLIRKKVLKNK